ncbi:MULTISPECIES: ankyrin repeat domain-containing protein [unclassified Achromobacter]|uniref:ankyrin repeat domain-containing protein n=1 Tax=unclassified Achromobacter TaxID=2626865 RepID=UPI000B519792|nr:MULTISPECIES: ankyrin repeat domain-containing protein [unclassified Achromobacter]OWT80033.1 hypothetical protein CEY05_00965 [Achromobacter sp. HZ34]OWT81916.1 hypothetical protein CEY04_00965 [Achromobacter sp. HZ28]
MNRYRTSYRVDRALAGLGLTLACAFTAAPPAQAARAADVWIYVVNDNAGDMKDLLASGWDPNQKNRGQPALMQAVRDGAWNVFDVLAADRRTDVNATNGSDETPLMYLALKGELKRAQALIARGAQVNRLGWTPLHYAASTGQVEMAKLLLSKQAIVNAPGPDGTTPLMMAGRSGNQLMAKLLLDAGADPTNRSLAGLNAADWARSAKQESLAAWLDQATRNYHPARTSSGGGNTEPAADAAAQPAPSAAEPTATVPSAPPAADNGGRSLGGVSGVQLNSYDDPPKR